MRRIRTITRALIGATIVAGGMAALAPMAQASTIPVACSENALIAAVDLANSTAATDTLALARAAHTPSPPPTAACPTGSPSSPPAWKWSAPP
jgi:hypothetical protein